MTLVLALLTFIFVIIFLMFSAIQPSNRDECGNAPTTKEAQIPFSVFLLNGFGISFPLWGSALIGYLLGVLGGVGVRIELIMMLAPFIVPIWGTVIISSWSGKAALFTAVCYYIGALVVALGIGGLALIKTAPGGLY